MNLGEKLNPVYIEIDAALWEHEYYCPNELLELSEGAFIAACKIFSSALMDKMWELQEKEGMPMEERVKMTAHAAKTIHSLVKQMTDINTKTFYTKKEKVIN